MKFSLNALNQFVDLKPFYTDPNSLAERLSSKGFEVDGFIQHQLDHTVIAKVTHKKKHPSADRLQLCEVKCVDKTYSIVCGAHNFKVGDKVALALPGAKLPLSGLKIKTQKIRGEVSEGMLLSAKEAGLASLSLEEETGILVLPPDTPIGENFAEYIGLNDIIFDIDILPHRPDCLSHFGLSRDPALHSGESGETVFPKTKGIHPTGGLRGVHQTRHSNETCHSRANGNLSQGLAGGGGDLGKMPVFSNEVSIDVTIEEDSYIKYNPRSGRSGCLRYTGRAMYGVCVRPSPLWLRVYLQNLGLKSINNIVDVTNYCLMQWGQPLHAFDLDRLEQKKLIVGLSKKGERLLTLDNQEITLTGEELCIRDGVRPVALAGVIGGKLSGVHPNTKNIFLESACFAPSVVRQAGKRFRIETDSSYRFSRGVAFESAGSVLQKALELIQRLAGGKAGKQVCDIGKNVRVQKPISISIEYVQRRLGLPVSATQFEQWMTQLRCEVQFKKRDNSFVVTPPSFRFDLNLKEDLLEEYARLESYDKIPETLLYPSQFPTADQKEYNMLSKTALILSHEGYYQAINHSFISKKFSAQFLSHTEQAEGTGLAYDTKNPLAPGFYVDPLLNGAKEPPVFIKNPLSAEHNMMRVSLLPSLFKNAQRSERHGIFKGRLFEIGKAFYSVARGGYKEHNRLGLMAWGQAEDIWERPDKRLCFYDLKTAFNALLQQMGIWGYEWVEGQNPPAFIHPFQYMVLKHREGDKGGVLAYMGSLNPEYAEHYKIRHDMALGEMDLDRFLDRLGGLVAGASLGGPGQTFKNLSPYPMVQRDLSFLIPKGVKVSAVMEEIKKQAGGMCRLVQIFDIYATEQNKKDKLQSVSFRITLQSDTKTLTEDDLKTMQEKIIKGVLAHHPLLSLRAI